MKSMNCKQCGAPLPEGAMLCSECGAKQEEKTKSKVYRLFLSLSEKKCLGLQLSTLFLLAAIIFPVIFLTLITAFLPVRKLYICVYIVSILFLCMGIALIAIRTHNARGHFTGIKKRLIFYIPYTVILALLIGVIGFLESPPSNELVGYQVSANLDELSMVRLTFDRSNVHIWLGLYKYSDYTSSGKLLDDAVTADLECSYYGKSGVIIDGESFFARITDNDKVEFPYTAKKGFMDSENSALFRMIVYSTKFSGSRWRFKNNWDFYFNTTRR